MTQETEDNAATESAASTPPLPLAELLTGEDEIAVFAELEALKLRMDVDKARFEELKMEAGALVAVAGGSSGFYGQIVVELKPGGKTKAFSTQKLITTKIQCPDCRAHHFFPAGRVAELYDYSTRKDSVAVSLAGKRGRKKTEAPQA